MRVSSRLLVVHVVLVSAVCLRRLVQSTHNDTIRADFHKKGAGWHFSR